MDLFTAIVSGFGLSAPAGLNAYLPLLITGLLARFTHAITLKPPFDVLTNTWVLIVLGVLLLWEVFADKIPGFDHINDIIHTFIRPVAGGILFAASTGAVGGMDPSVGFILGLLSAGSVHAVKATTRPLVTVTTAGIGNPLVSFVEDFVSGITTVLAIFAPFVAAAIMALLLLGAIYAIMKLRNWRRRRAARI